MSEQAYWKMIRADLGCDTCTRYNGCKDGAPCDKYDGLVEDEEGQCPEKEEL